MKTIKVSEAQGAALDWAVAKCEGAELAYGLTDAERYSTDWSQGGPIVERECMDVMFEGPEWYAYMRWESGRVLQYDGQTPLIAAMRCYVASKLGDKVEVPDDLL